MVATYNVHRWSGVPGGARFVPELAAAVIDEIEADVIALQEVLVPEGRPDPLIQIAGTLGMHVAFTVARQHRRGALGNAILSRWPLKSVFALDLSMNRIERRTAVAAELLGSERSVAIVATHLALIDHSRHRQVEALLDHPRLQGPVVLLGDLNSWRACAGTRRLERAFLPPEHHNRSWPASFPSARPVFALDRIYGRGARIVGLRSHTSRASRRGSDHLPVLATVQLDG